MSEQNQVAVTPEKKKLVEKFAEKYGVTANEDAK